jgi:calcium/calmodulin-dependent protein kinase I
VPELLERRKVRQRFKHAVLAASLKKKIADLKKDAGSDEDNEMRDAEQAVAPGTSAESLPQGSSGSKPSLRDTVKSGAFVQVVLAKVKDEKQKQEALEVDQELEQEARRRSRSFNGT